MKKEIQNLASKLDFDSNLSLLRTLLEDLPYCVMFLSPIVSDEGNIADFKILFANSSSSQVFGVDQEILIGSTISKEFNMVKSESLMSAFIKSFKEESSLMLDNQSEAIGGEVFQINGFKLGDGLYVSFKSVTSLQKKLKETKQESSIYQQLLQESVDCFFVLNSDLSIRETNRSFELKFNLPQKDGSELSFDRLFNDDEAFHNLTEKITNIGRIDEEEVELLNGESKVISCLISMKTFSQETDTCYVGLIRDISNKRRQEKLLVRAEKMLMSAKMSRTIAHEVRNPLTNLSLAIEQLKEETDQIKSEKADIDFYMNILDRNVNRIGGLITDLLNSSKIRELTLKEGALGDIVQSSHDLIKDRLKLTHIRSELNLSQFLPAIAMDQQQLQIAITNLLINAIEAMDEENGKIILTTYFDTNSASVCLSIEDNGVGISSEEIDHLFEPFYTNKRNGTGLGLTAVQTIMHAHSGSVEIESQPGQGTKFILSFPPMIV